MHLKKYLPILLIIIVGAAIWFGLKKFDGVANDNMQTGIEQRKDSIDTIENK